MHVLSQVVQPLTSPCGAMAFRAAVLASIANPVSEGHVSLPTLEKGWAFSQEGQRLRAEWPHLMPRLSAAEKSR